MDEDKITVAQTPDNARLQKIVHLALLAHSDVESIDMGVARVGEPFHQALLDSASGDRAGLFDSEQSLVFINAELMLMSYALGIDNVAIIPELDRVLTLDLRLLEKEMNIGSRFTVLDFFKYLAKFPNADEFSLDFGKADAHAPAKCALEILTTSQTNKEAIDRFSEALINNPKWMRFDGQLSVLFDE